MVEKKEAEILVIGGGLVGATCAFAFAQNGWQVIHCAPKPARKDTRTTAFLWQTVDFFRQLGLWDELQPKAFPLKTMRIVDATKRLLRAPQTEFNASEIDLEAFGYNLVNSEVLDVLNKHISANGNIDICHEPVATLTKDNRNIVADFTGGNKKQQITAKYVVGADGRNSLVRNTFFPNIRNWSYPQEAIVLDFSHQHSTNFVSTEFHTETGPFTVVPQSHTRAGLVWMERPERVKEIVQLPTGDLELLLEQKMQSFLGKVTLETPPASFPISGLVANCFGQDNVAIVGEAAHVFPPIGAQGFNLGARDVQTLIDVFKRHTNTENIGAQYDRLRKSDIETRTLGVDLLNRSLLSDFLPNQMIRYGGLYALSKITPLRKMVMKQGISPVRKIG